MVKCITWSILLQCSVLKGSFQVDATSYTPLTQTQLQSIYTSSWQHSPMAGRWGLRGSDLGNRCLITLGIWRPVWFLNIFFVAWIGSIVKLGGGGTSTSVFGWVIYDTEHPREFPHPRSPSRSLHFNKMINDIHFTCLVLLLINHVLCQI